MREFCGEYDFLSVNFSSGDNVVNQLFSGLETLAVSAAGGRQGGGGAAEEIPAGAAEQVSGRW